MSELYDDIPGDQLAKIAQAGQDVKELMEHPGWEPFVAEVQAHGQSLTDMLITSSPSSEAVKYADLCGQIRGIGSVEGLALEVIERGEVAEQNKRIMEAQA